MEDLFETSTRYDNRAIEAHYKPNGKKLDVDRVVSSKKLRAGELGLEKELPIDDLIDVGVYGTDGKLLLLEKRRLKQEQTKLTLTADAQPGKPGIDPLNKLIDRRPDDNVTPVVKAD